MMLRNMYFYNIPHQKLFTFFWTVKEILYILYQINFLFDY